ncbi:MAG: hypothetical protein ACI86H_001469 [bacterium]|jgi:hypothetical protein
MRVFFLRYVFSCLAMFFLSFPVFGSPKSTLTLTVNEEILNEIIAKTGSIKGKEKAQGSPISLPYAAKCEKKIFGKKIRYHCIKTRKTIPWTLTVNWEIRKVRVEIEPAGVFFRAELAVRGKTLSYTDPIKGRFDVSLQGSQLNLNLRQVLANLYVKFAGKKIKIKTLDLSKKIPANQRNIRIPLPLQPIHIRVAKQRKIVIKPAKPQLKLAKDFITVHLNLDLIK